jgi:hypothetical protein
MMQTVRPGATKKLIDAAQLLPKVRILGLGKLPGPADQGCREVACCKLPNALIEHRGLPDQSRQTPMSPEKTRRRPHLRRPRKPLSADFSRNSLKTLQKFISQLCRSFPASGAYSFHDRRADQRSSYRLPATGYRLSTAPVFPLPRSRPLLHFFTPSLFHSFTRSLIHFFTSSLLHPLPCSLALLLPAFPFPQSLLPEVPWSLPLRYRLLAAIYDPRFTTHDPRFAAPLLPCSLAPSFPCPLGTCFSPTPSPLPPGGYPPFRPCSLVH